MVAGLKAKTGIASMTQEDRRWLDYNYPPGLKMFHYSTEDLAPTHASLARKLNLAALVICLIQPISRKCVLFSHIPCFSFELPGPSCGFV